MIDLHKKEEIVSFLSSSLLPKDTYTVTRNLKGEKADISACVAATFNKVSLPPEILLIISSIQEKLSADHFCFKSTVGGYVSNDVSFEVEIFIKDFAVQIFITYSSSLAQMQSIDTIFDAGRENLLTVLKSFVNSLK